MKIISLKRKTVFRIFVAVFVVVAVCLVSPSTMVKNSKTGSCYQIALDISTFFRYRLPTRRTSFFSGGQWLLKTPDSCKCEGSSWDFCFSHPENAQLAGLRFPCGLKNHLIHFGLLKRPDPDSNPIMKSGKVAFVTAATAGQWPALHKLISSTQKFYPSHKIFVYDLGMDDDSMNLIRRYANVQIEDVSWWRFPDRIRDVQLGAWKPIVLAEALRKHSPIIWVSPDMEWRSGRLYTHLYPECEDWRAGCASQAPFLLLGHLPPAYNPSFLGFSRHFPVDPASIFLNASTMFIASTRNPEDQLLTWMVLCALDDDCWWCSSSESRVSCEPYLLAVLLRLRSAQSQRLPSSQLLEPQILPQSFCDFWCTFLAILTVVICFAFLSCLAIIVSVMVI